MKDVYAALLRGVNVLGRKTLRMADFQKGLAGLGYDNPHTYLQSGNAVFRAAGRKAPAVASAVKTLLAASFGLDVEVLVLTGPDLDRIVRSNPLHPERGDGETLFHATFLFRPVAESAFRKIAIPAGPGEKAAWGGDVIYLHCPNGYGRTKLNNTFFERSLGLPATTRNWRTVKALRDLCAGAA